MVAQLASDAVQESLHRVLGTAVRSLERNPAVTKSRSDLDERAPVAGNHASEGCARPPDAAEIRDLRGAPVLVRLNVEELREDGRHRIRDPGVDLAKLSFDTSGGVLDGLGIRDVEREREHGPFPQALELAACLLQRPGAPGENGDRMAALSQLAAGGAADTRCASGYHDDAHHTAAVQQLPSCCSARSIAVTARPTLESDIGSGTFPSRVRGSGSTVPSTSAVVRQSLGSTGSSIVTVTRFPSGATRNHTRCFTPAQRG